MKDLLVLLRDAVSPDPETDRLVLWGWIPLAVVVIGLVMSRG